MAKITLAKGNLSYSGKGLNFKVLVDFNCPTCETDLTADLYSARFTAILNDPKLVGASCGCKRCGGWILVKLINGFPTQQEIDKYSEIDIEILGPEPSSYQKHNG